MFTCLCLWLLAADPLPSGALTPGNQTREVQLGEVERSYLLHVPSRYDGARRVPVVLIFHGALSNARQMVPFCGLNEKADKEGFLAVYPEAIGRGPTWNAGDCCGSAVLRNVDDLAFTRVVLDDLAQVAKLDEQRIYATGMSNGAMLCYRLAAEMSDRIAAIAPVGGAMAFDECHPTRPVPVMHFHGTDDTLAPFDGRQGDRSQRFFRFHSVERSIQAWVTANGCPAAAKVESLPDKADDGLTVTRTTYGPGQEHSEVILFTIEGGGHTWPGRQLPFGTFLGKSTKDISANDLMWEFFERHPLK